MGRVLVQQPGTNTAKALTETLPKNVIIVDEDLKELRLHDGVTPGGKIIGQSAGSGVPIGTIIPFAGNSVPQGYLLCDGSAISRTDYASLFAVIGTIYGAGDGNSTFNLPELFKRTLVQYGTDYPMGTRSAGEIPNVTGVISASHTTYTTDEISGCFYTIESQSVALDGGGRGTVHRTIGFDASRSMSLYGGYGGVLPRSLFVKMIIKYI